MADGYARTSKGGVGCVCVTTGVGALSALNGIMMSYAERVPIVIISGTPFALESGKAQNGSILLHHTTGTSTSMTAEADIFKQVCCNVCFLDLFPSFFKNEKIITISFS